MDALIVKAKAILVAKGYSQVQDEHHLQTFGSIPSSASRRIMAAVPNEHSLNIFHINVAQALVPSRHDTETYMKLPGGRGVISRKIVRLNRSLYGLKQTGPQSGGFLAESGVEYDVEQHRSDPCVFRMAVDGQVELIMAVHADDIVITGSEETCRNIYSALGSKLPLTTWTNWLETLVAISSATWNWEHSR